MKLPWISIKDRLPKEGVSVPVWVANGGIGDHLEAFRGDSVWWRDIVGDIEEVEGVTHWLEVVPPEEIPEAVEPSNEYRCPKCGYTLEDAAMNGDHYLCVAEGGPPMPNVNLEEIPE